MLSFKKVWMINLAKTLAFIYSGLPGNLKSSCRKVSLVFKFGRVYMQIANLNNNVRLANRLSRFAVIM
jgi:hypothetical protein